MGFHPIAGKIIPWVMTYCANCGDEGTWVPEQSLNEQGGFVCYMCVPCSEKWAPALGLALLPDEYFYQECENAMLHEDGRVLSGEEVQKALQDPSHYLSKLKQDRK